jgi:hypothetical protein
MDADLWSRLADLPSVTIKATDMNNLGEQLTHCRFPHGDLVTSDGELL